MEIWYDGAVDDIIKDSERILNKNIITTEDMCDLAQYREFLQSELNRI